MSDNITLQNVSHTISTEIRLDPEDGRLNILPIHRHDIWEAYKKAEAAFWRVDEIHTFNIDAADWEKSPKLTPEIKSFIEYIIAFFAASDTLVNVNLAERFIREVPIPEARFFYDFQKTIENIHNLAYGRLIELYVKDLNKQAELFNAANNNPVVNLKARWAIKWIESSDKLWMRLVAFSAVEGIFFSSSFCAIYWIKHLNVLPSLTKLNELISRDEGMHTDFACLLFKKFFAEEADKNVVLDIIKEAVDIESTFVEQSLPFKFGEMNSDLMKKYVRCIADDLLISLGYTPYYGDRQPFPFAEKINIRNKTNFFEVQTTEYQKFQSPSASSITEEF